MGETLLTIGKLLIVALSFCGLCGLTRRFAGVSGTTAPLSASCIIIIVLMLGGMAGVLTLAWAVLFIAGLAGFVWHYVIRRSRPDPLAAVVCILFLLYALWHFRAAYIEGPDSVSHWGLAIKYLLREGRFPDSSTQLIFFHSYPLGTACFTSFFAHVIGEGEPVYIMAHMMLGVFAFLPVYGLVRKNRVFGRSLAMGALLFMLNFRATPATLQVDVLLALLTIGGMAAILQAETDGHALFAALPVIIALIYVKSSGILFALLLTAFCAISRPGARRRAVCAAAGLSSGAVAYALWTLHVKIAYPDGGGKHSLSLASYAETLSTKDSGAIRRLAIDMVKRLLHPSVTYAVLLILAAAALIGSAYLIRTREKDAKRWLRRLVRTAIGCACLYIAWYVMLFATYALSMTPAEMRKLASIARYEATGICCVMGIVVIFALRCFCRDGFDFGKRHVPGTSVAVILAAVLLLTPASGGLASCALAGMAKPATAESAAVLPGRRAIIRLCDRYDIEEGKSYLLLLRDEYPPLSRTYYGAKYELYSNDIKMLVTCINEADFNDNAFDPDACYLFRSVYMHSYDCETVDDVGQALRDAARDRDYVLVLSQDAVFEQALEGYDGDAPVLYDYR